MTSNPPRVFPEQAGAHDVFVRSTEICPQDCAHTIKYAGFENSSSWFPLKDFYDGMHEGNVITDLVRGLLAKSGYSVYLNGYEERFSEIKEYLNDKALRNSRTVRMIRSSPDLIVYDKKKRDVMLIEVKLRRAPKETSVKIYPEDRMHLVERYQEFWNDAILVIAVPCGRVFYAQKFGDLEIKKEYNAEIDFKRFEEFFAQVNETDLSDYRQKAIQAMK